MARVAFQGEHGAFSEAAALRLLGNGITTVPRATFDLAFRAIDDGAADALLAPGENTLAGRGEGGVGLRQGAPLESFAANNLRSESTVSELPGRPLRRGVSEW